MLLDLLNGYVDPSYYIAIIDALNNTCGDIIDYNIKQNLDYLNDLRKYESDPAFKELSKRDHEVFKFAKWFNCFTTVEEIKSGEYMVPNDYKISEEELELMRKAKMTEGINRRIHELYDEDNGERAKCNYAAIKDEEMKKYAYHTDADNPEFEIILEDGSIINYWRGDIRVKPFSMNDVIYYTKLQFIGEYYGEIKPNPIGCLLSHFNGIDPELDIYSMTDEEFARNLFNAFPEVYGKLYGLDQLPSESIKNKSNEQLEGMKQLIRKYNL